MKKYFNSDSDHNRIFSIFLFRCNLNDHFQQAIYGSRGIRSYANFSIENVSPDAFYDLYSAVKERMNEDNIILSTKEYIFYGILSIKKKR